MMPQVPTGTSDCTHHALPSQPWPSAQSSLTNPLRPSRHPCPDFLPSAHPTTARLELHLPHGPIRNSEPKPPPNPGFYYLTSLLVPRVPPTYRRWHTSPYLTTASRVPPPPNTPPKWYITTPPLHSSDLFCLITPHHHPLHLPLQTRFAPPFTNLVTMKFTAPLAFLSVLTLAAAAPKAQDSAATQQDDYCQIGAELCELATRWVMCSKEYVATMEA